MSSRPLGLLLSGPCLLLPRAKVVALVLLGSFGGGSSYIGVFSFVLFVLGDSVAICVYMAAATASPPPFNERCLRNYKNIGKCMKHCLQARNKYCFVDGSCVRDSYADSDVLFYSENAADVWKELNETYDKVDGSIVYNLIQKIGSVKQGGSTVADYYHKLNSLWREFDAITKVPKCVCPIKCSCAASTELALHQQLMKLMQFLMGLDDCYQPVRTALLTRDPLPDVKDAYATVSREESHRGIPETPEVIDAKMHATSFAAKSYNQNKKGTRSQMLLSNMSSNLISMPIVILRKVTSSPLLVISHCPLFTSKRHNKCRKKLKVISSNLINDPHTGNTQANMAGRVFLSLMTITLGWIIDSGANQHLTTSTTGMTNVVDISNLNITVGHPNGTVATISHIGDLRLSNNVILHDVLVVPGYCVSFLSVNKLVGSIFLNETLIYCQLCGI
ncbi:ribonuclease H-like domain-containing protein [Tanacetum coccineum]